MATPKSTDHDKASRDNRSRQLNPNNDAYWTSRGCRPPSPKVPIPPTPPQPTTQSQRRR